MFTLIIKSRLLGKDHIRYIIDRDIHWVTETIPPLLDQIQNQVGLIDTHFDYNENKDPTLNNLVIDFKDADHKLTDENHETLLKWIDQYYRPYLLQSDRQKSYQVYWFSAIDKEAWKKELYEQVIMDHRLNNGIQHTYLFSHPDSEMHIVYHAGRPLTFDTYPFKSITGPHLQHLTYLDEDAISLEHDTSRVTTITWIEVKDRRQLLSLYTVYKNELDLHEKLLNATYATQDHQEIKENDDVLELNALYRFKQSDSHALRLIEHSVLKYKVPYFIVKTDENNPDEIQYIYLDGDSNRFETLSKLKGSIPSMTVKNISQRATDVSTVANGYGIILPKENVKSDEFDHHLFLVLLAITANETEVKLNS